MNWLKYYVFPYFYWLIVSKKNKSLLFFTAFLEEIVTSKEITYQDITYYVELKAFIYRTNKGNMVSIWYTLSSEKAMLPFMQPIILRLKPDLSWTNIFGLLYDSLSKHPELKQNKVPARWFALQLVDELKENFRWKV